MIIESAKIFISYIDGFSNITSYIYLIISSEKYISTFNSETNTEHVRFLKSCEQKKKMETKQIGS